MRGVAWFTVTAVILVFLAICTSALGVIYENWLLMANAGVLTVSGLVCAIVGTRE